MGRKRTLTSVEKERKRKARLKHIDTLITYAYAVYGIPENKLSEWCKREALSWPWEMDKDFIIYSARMYYEATQWAENVNNYYNNFKLNKNGDNR